ncbi:MAG: LysM peptidoglycan-binding domain-containing protein [Synechococcus sp.]|nr:LysM peptidoglycan-binding domain-containing protein [Synechococcus sp.]
MRRALIAALALSALMPLQAFGGSVTVRSGDTLSDIANRHGVTLSTLMRLNNLRDANHVEVGQRLRLPGPTVRAGRGRHTVASGESLSEIASRYRVSPSSLVALNNLRDANHVEVGQRLRLPSNAVLPAPSRTQVARPQPEPIKVSPNATSHTVGRGQTLTQIARAYEVSVTSLVDINSISDPNKVEIGTKLLLRRPPEATKPALSTQSVPESSTTNSSTSSTDNSTTSTSSKPTVVATATTKPASSVAPKQADWRSYGPLKVDWANWQTMAGSEVAPTLNADGQPLYLAVNCAASKINVTGANGAWKTWSEPENEFERDLVKDRCSQ